MRSCLIRCTFRYLFVYMHPMHPWTLYVASFFVIMETRWKLTLFSMSLPSAHSYRLNHHQRPIMPKNSYCLCLYLISFNDFFSWWASWKPLENVVSVRFNKHIVNRILRILSTTAYDIPKIDKNIQFEKLYL